MTIAFNVSDPIGSYAHHLSSVVKAVKDAKRCIVITGAGISVNGGIPDFRSSDGLYNLVKQKYPTAVVKGQDLFDATLFKDPLSTRVFYSFMGELKQVLRKANHTKTHQFIRTLDTRGKLLRCYTQNIDCLEERVELSIQMVDKKQVGKVVQLHGNMNLVACTICQARFDFTEEFESVFINGTPPGCPDCNEKSMMRAAANMRSRAVGTLRPDIILYNEHHPRGDLIADITMADLRKKPDLLIVMGTSLKVVGIKRLVKDLARQVHELKSGKVILINMTEIATKKEWEGVFDYQVLGDTDKVVTLIEREVEILETEDAARRKKREMAKEEKLKREAEAAKGQTTIPFPVVKKEPMPKQKVNSLHPSLPKLGTFYSDTAEDSKENQYIPSPVPTPSATSPTSPLSPSQSPSLIPIAKTRLNQQASKTASKLKNKATIPISASTSPLGKHNKNQKGVKTQLRSKSTSPNKQSRAHPYAVDIETSEVETLEVKEMQSKVSVLLRLSTSGKKSSVSAFARTTETICTNLSSTDKNEVTDTESSSLPPPKLKTRAKTKTRPVAEQSKSHSSRAEVSETTQITNRTTRQGTMKSFSKVTKTSVSRSARNKKVVSDECAGVGAVGLVSE